MNLGNLDNLSFGMGLGRAKPGQYIPAENANLDGFDDTSNNYLGLAIFAAIFVLIFMRKRGA